MCIIDHYPLGNQRTEISGELNISEKLGRDSRCLICAVSSWWEGFTYYRRGFSADWLVNAVSVVVVMVLVEGRRVPITNIKLFKVPSVGTPWD